MYVVLFPELRFLIINLQTIQASVFTNITHYRIVAYQIGFDTCIWFTLPGQTCLNTWECHLQQCEQMFSFVQMLQFLNLARSMFLHPCWIWCICFVPKCVQMLQTQCRLTIKIYIFFQVPHDTG